jgi:RNA polymerase sigma-70 factor (sigma-E family)
MRATFPWITVLLGGVEPVVSDPLDELAAPDVISGGGEDFSAFAAARWPGLVRLAFGLTGDRWAAEDIAQATLARTYVAWRRVSRADDPDAYLRRILVNTSNRRFRRHRVTEQPGDPPETAVEDPADLVGERAALLAALRQLPPRQRAVVVLRYWEDLTDAQIGAALGCSPGTVRSQLSRALAKLRESPVLGEGDER